MTSDPLTRQLIAAEGIGTLVAFIKMGLLDEMPTVKARTQKLIDDYDATFPPQSRLYTEEKAA